MLSLCVLQAQAAELDAARHSDPLLAGCSYTLAAQWWRRALRLADDAAAMAAAPSSGSWATLCHTLAAQVIGCQEAAAQLAGVR